MKSTDVGLYNVAREIFSYLEPEDLMNLIEIGETNKTFEEFLKKENNFLRKKFETVTVKVLKKYTGMIIGQFGTIRTRRIAWMKGVFVRIDCDKPGGFTYVTFTGVMGSVKLAVDFVGLQFRGRQTKYYLPQYHRSDNSEVIRSVDEKFKAY